MSLDRQPSDEPARPQADESRLRLASIVDSSDDAIVSKDLEGTVTSWNPAAERIFGYTAEEMVGRPIRIIIPLDRQHEEDEVLRRVRIGERVDHFETVRQRKDGSLVDISLMVSPIRGSNGEVIGASKIARDITAQKRAETQVAAAAVLKEEFLSMVSHELRTPTTVIIGNAAALLKSIPSFADEAQVQALRDIASEGERLQRVIEHLLTLTGLGGSQNLDFEPISFRSLVVARLEARQHRNPARRIDAVIPAALPFVRGKADLIAMVIDNLLSNADKYSPPDTAVEVELASTHDGEVELRVRDHGFGVDEAELVDIFEPFHRTSEARKQASGMGLGLAVCKRIVEAHRGCITAHNLNGEGMEFVVTLPAVP